MMTELIDVTNDGTVKRLHDQLVECITDLEWLLLHLQTADPLVRDKKLMSLRRLLYNVECMVYDKVDDKYWFNKLLLEAEACRDGLRDVYKYIKKLHD
jgi:hypothetical protein